MLFIGCDVSKRTLDVSFQQNARSRRFSNTRGGFADLVRWIEKHGDGTACVILEATCVYHLPVSEYLAEHGVQVLVANPARAHSFASAQGLRNKNDKLDADTLGRFGRSLDLARVHLYQPSKKIINQLKALLKRYTQVEKDLQRERNRLEKCTFIPDSDLSARSIERQVAHLEAERDLLQVEIRKLIHSDERLKHDDQLLRSITGIGPTTAPWLLMLLHENRFSSARQLAAFLGLTPRHRSSGTKVQRGQIPNDCDRRLRARFYYPAVTAQTHDPNFRALHQRLISNGRTQKQALTAVMRKLVHVAFGVIKHQTEYNPEMAS